MIKLDYISSISPTDVDLFNTYSTLALILFNWETSQNDDWEQFYNAEKTLEQTVGQRYRVTISLEPIPDKV